MALVHNARFYNPTPRAIYCMALHRKDRKLALSRSDASIEIWNIQYLPFIERTIPGTPSQSIEGLAWCNNRLFSVGLDCLLVEYDLFALTKKETASVTGEAAHCLSVNPHQTHVAVGTEQGYLNIFTITEDGILFEKFLDKQEGRVLCLKYEDTGKFLVSGSIDTVRIWDVETGHAIHKMTTGRSEVNKQTIVWCLDIVDDFVIITGDSRGKLTFWDGNVGSLIESYQSHKADILTIAVSEDQNTLFCSGVDPNVMSYVKIQAKDESHRWMKNIQRKIHDHDVRALILFQNKLYSAGVDSYLACSYHPPKTLIKYPPFPQRNCVTVCKNAPFVLLQYPTKLEVWQLGTQTCVEAKKLLLLERKVYNDSKKYVQEGIIHSAISSDGKWIVFCTDTVTKLFSVTYEEDFKPALDNIKLPLECPESVNAVFNENYLELVLALRYGSIVVIDLEQNILKQKLQTKKLLEDTITHLVISPCGKCLVTADPKSNIVVWNKFHGQWKFNFKLAKYDCSPTAIGIHPHLPVLIVAYSDQKIVEYNLFERVVSSLLDSNRLKKCLNKSFPVRNITFNLNNDNVVILHDDSHICVVKKSFQDLTMFTKSIQKKSAKERKKNMFYETEYHCTNINKYKHLVHLEYTSGDEIVAVEVNPLALLVQLPPCFKQNAFGTK